MWKVIGHKNQKELLDKAIAKKQYAHAYLFCGPQGIGKKTLALEFAVGILTGDGLMAKDGLKAKNILKAETVSAAQSCASPEFNPDLIILDQEKIKIEDIRNLISALSLRPYFYNRKIAVIDNFESATPEAANSILKTLEEPNSSTVIILIAQSRKSVLPTIASRTQIINFSRLSEDEMLQAAVDREAKKYLRFFNGKPGKMFSFQSGDAFRESFIQNLKVLQNLKLQKPAGRLSFIKEFSDFDSGEIARVLDNWMDVEQSAVAGQPHGSKNLRLFLEAISGLKKNFNKKMVLERVFLEMV